MWCFRGQVKLRSKIHIVPLILLLCTPAPAPASLRSGLFQGGLNQTVLLPEFDVFQWLWLFFPWLRHSLKCLPSWQRICTLFDAKYLEVLSQFEMAGEASGQDVKLVPTQSDEDLWPALFEASKQLACRSPGRLCQRLAFFNSIIFLSSCLKKTFPRSQAGSGPMQDVPAPFPASWTAFSSPQSPGSICGLFFSPNLLFKIKTPPKNKWLIYVKLSVFQKFVVRDFILTQLTMS